MTGHCCSVSARPQHESRRFSRITASIVPGALLAILPKCPLCLAAWLTVATGFSFSAGAAEWIRGILVLMCAVVLAGLIWRFVAANARRYAA